MMLYFLYLLILIISGILAIPTLILSKKPSAKDLLDKVLPYQGWFGVIIIFIGLFEIIDLLSEANLYFTFGFGGRWVLLLVTAIIMIILGFLLGFNLINHYILSKNPKSQVTGKNLITKLLPFQNILGIAAIVLGLFLLIMRIF